MTNERRAELMRAMQGEPDDQSVLFINGWGPPEITCAEMRSLLTSAPSAPQLLEQEIASLRRANSVALCQSCTRLREIARDSELFGTIHYNFETGEQKFVRAEDAPSASQEEPTQAHSTALIERLKARTREGQSDEYRPCQNFQRGNGSACDNCYKSLDSHLLRDALEALSSSAPVERPTREELIGYLAQCYRATGSIQTPGCSDEETAGLAVDAVQMLAERAGISPGVSGLERRKWTMTNERRDELARAMDGHSDDEPVLFLQGWSPSELTCGELRALLDAPQVIPVGSVVSSLLRWQQRIAALNARIETLESELVRALNAGVEQSDVADAGYLLLEMTPWVSSYQVDSCFFCSARMGTPHHATCCWQSAKDATPPASRGEGAK